MHETAIGGRVFATMCVRGRIAHVNPIRAAADFAAWLGESAGRLATRFGDAMDASKQGVQNVVDRMRPGASPFGLGAWLQHIADLPVRAIVMAVAPVLAIGAGVPLLLILALAYAPTRYLPGSDDLWLEFEHAADRARGVAMYDARGRYLGVTHTESMRDHLGQYTREELAPWGFFPDHVAVPVSDAPPYFWRCLVHLEDRYRGELRNPQGVDVVSLLAIPLTNRGGSTIEMQIARSIWMMHRDNSNPLTRKLLEWRAAPVLNNRLTDSGDDRRLRAWAAQHIPLVLAAGDEGDIYGVEAASQFLFGERAASLSPAKQLLLAAAVQRPIRWRQSAERQHAVLERLIGTTQSPGRARLCTRASAITFGNQPVIGDEPTRQTALEELNALLADSRQFAPVTPEFETYLRPLRNHPAGPRLGPTRLGMALASNEQREAIAEMVDAFASHDADEAGGGQRADYVQHPWRGRASEIRLTLDMAANLAFRSRVREALFAFSASGADERLRPGALPSRAPSRAQQGQIEIDSGDTPVLVVAADADGRIVRYYNSSSDSAYMGGANQRPDIPGFGNGPYELAAETRQMGSIAKTAVALLLARSGALEPDTLITTECIRGTTRNCWRPGDAEETRMTPVREAFGRSLNAAIARQLAIATPLDQTDAFMHSFGFTLPEPHRPSSLNVALGRYVGRPRDVHLLAAVALAVARGAPGPVVTPHIIDGYVAFDTVREDFPADAESQFSHRRVDLAPFSSAQMSGFVRSVLSEPICDAERGTLRNLHRWCAAGNAALRVHIAKSGTVSAMRVGQTNYNESDWWIAGGVEFADGRAYSYIVSIGAGSSRHAFANNLGSASAAPLVDILLTDLMIENVTGLGRQ